jgi:hypothetical protein
LALDDLVLDLLEDVDHLLCGRRGQRRARAEAEVSESESFWLAVTSERIVEAIAQFEDELSLAVDDLHAGRDLVLDLATCPCWCDFRVCSATIAEVLVRIEDILQSLSGLRCVRRRGS